MRLITLALILVALTARTAIGDEPLQQQISVYGTATTEITPDILRWQITITNKSEDLNLAAKSHSALVVRVLDLLKAQGIKAEDTQTADMRFGENWVYRNNSRERDGYLATSNISFKLADLGKYSDIWIGLAAIPEVSISAVQFDSTRRIEVQNETRRKALIAARQKATEMALALNTHIGEPLSIEEIPDDLVGNWGDNLRNSNVIGSFDGMNGAAGDSALSPGRISVQIRVRVSFRLVSGG